jgi:hypothetical protein
LLPSDEALLKLPLPEDDLEPEKMWQGVNEMRRTEDATLIYIADWRKVPLSTDQDYMKIVNWCCKASFQMWYTRGRDLDPSQRRSQEECRRTVRSIENALDAIRLIEIGAGIGMKYRLFRYNLGFAKSFQTDSLS